MFEIIIANFGLWFNILIPFVVTLYLVLTHNEYIMKEFGIQFGATVAYVFLMFLLLFSTTTDLVDNEYWGGKVSTIEYNEEWTERVTYTEQQCSGSGNNKSCRTVTKTRNDYHSPYWEIITSNNETISINKDEFRNAANKFGSVEVDVYHSNQVSFGDGDKYVVTPTEIIPTTVSHSFTNLVVAAKDNVINQKVNPEEIKQGVKNGTLVPYPTLTYGNYGNSRIDRLIDPKNIVTGINSFQYNKELDIFSANIGASKQANPMIYVTSEPIGFKYILEAYWKKAKKNDVILILGVEKGKVVWSDSIAWTNNTDFGVDCSSDFKDMNISDVKGITSKFENLLVTEYVRKPMEEFAYLKDNITLEWYWQVLILLGNIALNGFLFYKFSTNYERKFTNRF